MKIIISLLLAVTLIGCTSIKHSLFDFGVGVERSLSDLERKQLNVGGYQWVYLESQDSVQDKPVVILLHGFAAEKDNWTRMARFLEGYHIIAPDLPGHGETTYLKDDFYGFDQQSLRLAEFINALGLTQFHLVGNSMGGAIAALYAYRHPGFVSTLSLIDAVGFYGEEPSELQRLIEQNKPNPLIVRSPEDMSRLMSFAMEQVPFLPWPATDVLADRAMAREQANDQIFNHIYKESESARYSGGFTHIFEKLAMPTYVLWGEQDRVLHVSSVDKFLEHTPKIQTDILPNVGHAPMLEVPEITAGLLQSFWVLSESASQVANHALPESP
ncbi:MAG: alpha/beta hydrolase [Bermanella sp.]|nr:alpha/beta hydrolase [Bermanella sp.]|tara:strand:- start:2819 stop:3802 length:984 start_codon:yes stop_codon:yes gene_type:complete